MSLARNYRRRTESEKTGDQVKDSVARLGKLVELACLHNGAELEWVNRHGKSRGETQYIIEFVGGEKAKILSGDINGEINGEIKAELERLNNLAAEWLK